jgi:prepilin-type N-terminal cleavage/methylation domain-containing protein
MQQVKPKERRKKRGFTIIELLIVVAIIVILVSILVPSLGKAFSTAKAAQDKNQLKGIHAAMLLEASGDEGRLTQPSSMSKDYPDASHDMSDTTANLMSLLLARNYFATDLLISPVETNANIRDINENDLIYDFDSIDGEETFWDDQFKADLSTASAGSPAHNSYAHQALCGERVRLKWNSAAKSSDIILSNRGPESSVSTDGSLLYNDESNTLKFHGEENLWRGNIVAGDGSTRMVQSYLPEGIGYQPLNGGRFGPDNIFLTDWNDIQIAGNDEPMASGDNWMVICTEVIGDNEIVTVWD